MIKPRISCLVVFTTMLCVSCSSEKAFNAEQALDQTISNVAQKQNLAFQGQSDVQVGARALPQVFSFEGMIVSSDELYLKRTALSPRLAAVGEDQWIKMKSDSEADPQQNIFGDWNPRAQLNLLKDVRKTVHAEADPSIPGNHHVLQVEVNSDDWNQVIKNRWQSQINGFKTGASVLQAKSKQGQAEENQQAREIQQMIQKAQQRIQAITPTMVSKGRYRIVLDTLSQLPTEMTIETDLSYKEEGEPKAEKLRSSYKFTPNAKNITPPSIK
jgi:hypothetical protein